MKPFTIGNSHTNFQINWSNSTQIIFKSVCTLRSKMSTDQTTNKLTNSPSGNDQLTDICSPRDEPRRTESVSYGGKLWIAPTSRTEKVATCDITGFDVSFGRWRVTQEARGGGGVMAHHVTSGHAHTLGHAHDTGSRALETNVSRIISHFLVG